jgi:hypothetical protein
MCQNAVPEVLFQKDSSQNSVPEPVFSGFDITPPPLQPNFWAIVCILEPVFFRKIALI